MEIPTDSDWEDAAEADDLDLPYAYQAFGGKSNSEIQPLLKADPLERSFEIWAMPIKPFQYYILGFRDFVLSRDFEFLTGSDAASGYLRLVQRKLKTHPHFIAPIFPSLAQSIEYISNNQSNYDADLDIYGDFRELANEIFVLYKQFIERTKNGS
jgi:hypothetical protein